MGGKASKTSKEDIALVQPGTKLPELPPYSGYPVEYNYVTIIAELDAQSHFSFMPGNVTVQATNIESYHEKLAAKYREGFKLLTLVAHPGSLDNYHLPLTEQNEIYAKFRGVFRKMAEKNGEWQLHILKSTVTNQMFQSWSGEHLLNTRSLPKIENAGTTSNSCSSPENMLDSYHLFQTLSTIAQEGGRLVGLELTGISREQIELQRRHVERRLHHDTIGVLPEMQVVVDVLFEVPCQPSGERYLHHTLCCPMTSTYSNQFPRGHHFTSTFDWQTATSQCFQTGWKLVDIIEDYSMSNLTHFRGVQINGDLVKNCLWIFEKPLSRIDNHSPCYEGSLVEHWVESSARSQALGPNMVADNGADDWDQVLEHYGKHGWEVVKILETPDKKIEGVLRSTPYRKLMIFLQRLIA